MPKRRFVLLKAEDPPISNVFTLLDYSLDFILIQEFSFPQTHGLGLLAAFAQSLFLDTFLTELLILAGGVFLLFKRARYKTYHISQTTESK